MNQQLCTLQVTIMVGGDISNEVGGMVSANDMGADLYFHYFLRYLSKRKYQASLTPGYGAFVDNPVDKVYITYPILWIAWGEIHPVHGQAYQNEGCDWVSG